MKATQPPSPTFHPGRHLEILDAGQLHDPYQEVEKFSEPAVCSDCGAVFHDGRWQWITPSAHANQTRCAACRRIQENQPAGYVTVEGRFAQDHREEMLNLVRNLETREKAEHPLKRIMAIEEQGDKLEITTTDIHLARGIGEALQHAYKGDLDFHYNKDEYLVRVHWRR
ncbi:MAG: ATPase [Burkholderiales bacterium RIFCSPLOWO2_02_FULL_57_36]|nr:MAG: ATPase [Burkholderiales bacterium RIFCSPLOWO2_02_FULL_57_36]